MLGRVRIYHVLPDRLMVGHQVLVLSIEVRILVGQHFNRFVQKVLN